MKQLIFLYVLLVLFEGALRKWFLPFLATPLLVVRDPLAILIIFNYLAKGGRIMNAFTLPVFGLSILAFLFTLALGHGNLFVDVYGVRILLLHFPLVFILGDILNKSEVEKMGRWLIYLLPPITLLVILQFYSPQSAWVNRGVGGDISGAGFAGAMGYARPSGIFSFTNGNRLYYSLTVPFVLYFWGQREKISTLALLAGTVCILLAIPFSISRAYFLQVALSIVFFILASLRSGRSVKMLFMASVLAVVSFLVLSQLSFVRTGMEVLTTRFSVAEASEGSIHNTIGERFFGGMARAISSAADVPLWGYGLGLGPNVGSGILTGSRGFLLAENEWGRIVGEMGLLFGIPIILIRLLLAAKIAIKGIQALFKGNSLPFLLLSFSLQIVIIGGW
ncbi:MAG: hypothetical protein AAGA62_05580, partial [Bacteroidota bacterium]